jgi:hypothetical protein
MMFINKEKLKQLITESVIEALTVDMTWEKRRDENTGLPLAVPEFKTEKVFLPSFIAQNIKFQEGAFRGVQEDFGKRQGEIAEATKHIEALGKFLISAQPMFVKLAQFSDLIVENKRKALTDASDD